MYRCPWCWDSIFFQPGLHDRRGGAHSGRNRYLNQDDKVIKRPSYYSNGHGEESFRTLRTNLMLSLRWGEKVFLITSAKPQEGKSAISTKLADSYAVVKNRLLVVDADFRRPDVHRIYGLPNEVGLTDILKGTACLEQACHTVGSGISVLTSGSFAFDPQELLEAERIQEVLNEMRNKFDVVIIDSAPVLVVADTLLLAPHVDGVLLVMRYGVVRDTEAAEAKERLERSRAKVLGGILNCFEDYTPKTGAYDGYYYVEPADPSGNGRNPKGSAPKIEKITTGRLKE